MAETVREFEDATDEWSRLRRRLRQLRDDAASTVLSGSCSPEEYRAACARHECLKEILDITTEIRRGDDMREATIKREPLRSVEE